MSGASKIGRECIVHPAPTAAEAKPVPRESDMQRKLATLQHAINAVKTARSAVVDVGVTFSDRAGDAATAPSIRMSKEILDLLHDLRRATIGAAQ